MLYSLFSAGTPPMKEVHFDVNKDIFLNPWLVEDDYIDIFDRIRWQWERRVVRPPDKPSMYTIPFILSDSIDIPHNVQTGMITWVGHSTFLIQTNGVNILTDPVWSNQVGPLPGIGPKRQTPPAISWDKLPRIDIVLISHNHYDHLDKRTVLRLESDFQPVFIVPLGLERLLDSWGISRILELNWWDSIRVGDIVYTCTPAQHSSQRGLFDKNKTLWSGWMISALTSTIFFAGDTGYFPGFSEIGNRFPGIDVALLPIGAHKPEWYMRAMHMGPRDALRAFHDLRAKHMIGMHWGAFDGSDERMDSPPIDILHLADSLSVDANSIWTLALGESRVVPHEY
jgi:N-acyl-phosphatidylethanolamine-hydrolysing phospholipase D